MIGNIPSRVGRWIRETSGPTWLKVGSVADGQFTKRVGATLVGATVTGTGGGGASAQLPIDAAAIASVGSGDLANGTSLDGGWSALQSTALTSVDRSVDGYIILKNSGNTAGQDRGIQRAFSPAGDFEVYAALKSSTYGYNYVWSGVFVGKSDPSDAAGGNRLELLLVHNSVAGGPLRVKCAKMAAGGETVVFDLQADATSMGAATRVAHGHPWPAWLRIKRVSTTLTMSVCWDGIQFIDLPTTTTISFTVDTIGLILGQATDTRNCEAVFDYIATVG